jgi:hypothetical protein
MSDGQAPMHFTGEENMKNNKLITAILSAFCFAMIGVAMSATAHAQDRMSSPPSWAVGTFYSTNGTNITMTIASNGQVTVINAGQTFYGTYYRGSILVNGDTSTVSRNGNGIRTYNQNGGQTTDYSRNNNNGGWNGSGNMSAPPNWAVGNFYSTNDSYIQISIAPNGEVTAHNNGLTYYGTYYRGSIYLNGDTSTVSKNGNGIRTYNRNTRQTTEYTRVNNGGGWNGSGNMSAPPNWAVGTFYSTNGTNITMTLAPNGQVTVINNGQTYYGTYYRGSILLNGDTSAVTQNGNGIRTYNRNAGQTTDYSRNAYGNDGNGNMSSPPNWARGTFDAILSNGNNVTLTIDSDGRVTANVAGSVYYGTYYNGAITINGDVSNVTKINHGIRTVNSRNGELTNYRRR